MSPSMARAMEETAEFHDEISDAQAEEGADVGSSPNDQQDHSASTSSDMPSVSETRELRGILEALLFMASDPLPITRIVSLLGGISKQEVEQALMSLRHEYEQEGRGLHLAEVAGGYRIVTKPDYAPWIKRLEKVKAPPKLSRSGLESLAIIAYKQPIVRAEIEQIRGVETSGVLRTLLERKLVRIVGRKEEPGRPIMYGTTRLFLEHFGLRDLSQLPPLREFKELRETEQAMLPMDEEGEFQPTSSEPSLCEEDSGVATHEQGNIVEDSEQSEEFLLAESVDRA